MKRREKTEAVVLKRTNIGEADKLVTLFTRSLGKIRVKAPGIRRINSRRAPHLELFNHIEVSLNRSQNALVVSEVQLIDGYASLKDQISQVGLAFYICEVVDRLLPESQSHPSVYDLLTQVLADLSTPGGGERNTKEFIVQLLWELGFLPKGEYPKMGVTAFVEDIIENKIKSRKFIDQSKYGKSG